MPWHVPFWLNQELSSNKCKFITLVLRWGLYFWSLKVEDYIWFSWYQRSFFNSNGVSRKYQCIKPVSYKTLEIKVKINLLMVSVKSLFEFECRSTVSQIWQKAKSNIDFQIFREFSLYCIDWWIAWNPVPTDTSMKQLVFKEHNRQEDIKIVGAIRQGILLWDYLLEMASYTRPEPCPYQ